jgi:hypothetical protein
VVIIVKDPIKLDWGRHVRLSSNNSYYYFTVHPHTNLGNKPIHISEIDQFSIWSIQCIIVFPTDEKLANRTSVLVYGFGPLCIGERNWLLEGQIPVRQW